MSYLIDPLEPRRLLSTVADGTYSVHESYSVAVFDPYGNRQFTRTGAVDGQIVVSNDSFQLVNKAPGSVGPLDATIEYNGSYTVRGRSVLYGIGNTSNGFVAVVKLGFFVVTV